MTEPVKHTRDALRAMNHDQLIALATHRGHAQAEPGEVKKKALIDFILEHQKKPTNGVAPTAPAEAPPSPNDHPFFKPDDYVRCWGDMGKEVGHGSIITLDGHHAMVKLDGVTLPHRFQTSKIKHAQRVSKDPEADKLLDIPEEFKREVDPNKPLVMAPPPAERKLVMPESSKTLKGKGAKSQKTPKQQQVWKYTGVKLQDGVKLPKQMGQILVILQAEKDGLAYHELLRQVDATIKTKQGAKAVVGYYRSRFIELGLVKVS